MKELAPNRLTITAKDDDIVPSSATKEMAEKLESELIVLEEGKHFIGRDGYTSFPRIYTEIKKRYL